LPAVSKTATGLPTRRPSSSKNLLLVTAAILFNL
jgi:hypothetical protein